MSDEDIWGSGATGAGDDSDSIGQASSGAEPVVTDKTAALEAQLADMQRTLQQVQGESVKSRQQAEQQDVENRIRTALAKAEGEVANAEAALAAAYDEGDGMAIAKAQRALTSKVATHDRMTADADNYRRRAREEAQRPAAAPAETDDSNLKQWRAKHVGWYGVDSEMTQAALAIDRSIREQGVLEVGSKSYFEAIDRQLASRYPEKMRGSPSTPGGHREEQTAPVKHRISQSIADGYRRMGLDVSNPDVLKQVMAARQTAVEKGMVPATPTRERVR